MATPEQVSVWVGLDVGKEEHFAEVLDDEGEQLFSRSLVNDQTALEALQQSSKNHSLTQPDLRRGRGLGGVGKGRLAHDRAALGRLLSRDR